MATTTLDGVQSKSKLGSAHRSASPSLVGTQSGVDSPRKLADWFERVYADADFRADLVPWCRGRANPFFISWLNVEAPSIIRPGARVAVAACGLGHDVAELVNRGYDAFGFDVSPTCVRWAQEEHPDLADRFFQADLLDPPVKMRGRFDLVVEINTLQSVPPRMRHALAHGLAWMLHRHGMLVAVARGRDASIPIDEVAGPPYALTAGELETLFAAEGLTPTRDIDDFFDDNDPPVRRLRGVFAVDQNDL